MKPLSTWFLGWKLGGPKSLTRLNRSEQSRKLYGEDIDHFSFSPLYIHGFHNWKSNVNVSKAVASFNIGNVVFVTF